MSNKESEKYQSNNYSTNDSEYKEAHEHEGYETNCDGSCSEFSGEESCCRCECDCQFQSGDTESYCECDCDCACGTINDSEKASRMGPDVLKLNLQSVNENDYQTKMTNQDFVLKTNDSFYNSRNTRYLSLEHSEEDHVSCDCNSQSESCEYCSKENSFLGTGCPGQGQDEVHFYQSVEKNPDKGEIEAVQTSFIDQRNTSITSSKYRTPLPHQHSSYIETQYSIKAPAPFQNKKVKKADYEECFNPENTQYYSDCSVCSYDRDCDCNAQKKESVANQVMNNSFAMQDSFSNMTVVSAMPTHFNNYPIVNNHHTFQNQLFTPIAKPYPAMVNQLTPNVLNFNHISNNQMAMTTQQIYGQNHVYQTYQPQPGAFFVNTTHKQKPIQHPQNPKVEVRKKKSTFKKVTKKLNKISKTLKNRENAKESLEDHHNNKEPTKNKSKDRASISNLSEARKLCRDERLKRKKSKKRLSKSKSKNEPKEPDWKNNRYSMGQESLNLNQLVKKLDQLEAIADAEIQDIKNLQSQNKTHNQSLEEKRLQKRFEKNTKSKVISAQQNLRDKIFNETMQRIEDLQNISQRNLQEFNKKAQIRRKSRSRSQLKRKLQRKYPPGIDINKEKEENQQSPLSIDNLLVKLQNCTIEKESTYQSPGSKFKNSSSPKDKVEGGQKQTLSLGISLIPFKNFDESQSHAEINSKSVIESFKKNLHELTPISHKQSKQSHSEEDSVSFNFLDQSSGINHLKSQEYLSRRDQLKTDKLKSKSQRQPLQEIHLPKPSQFLQGTKIDFDLTEMNNKEAGISALTQPTQSLNDKIEPPPNSKHNENDNAFLELTLSTTNQLLNQQEAKSQLIEIPLDPPKLSKRKKPEGKENMSLADAFKNRKSEVARRLSLNSRKKLEKRKSVTPQKKVFTKEELWKKRKEMRAPKTKIAKTDETDKAEIKEEPPNSKSVKKMLKVKRIVLAKKKVTQVESQNTIINSETMVFTSRLEDSFTSNSQLKSKNLNFREHTPNKSRLSLPVNLNRPRSKTPNDKVLTRLALGQKTKLSKKEIKDVNRRMYKKLPEVKKADKLKKKKQDFRNRQAKLKAFNKVSSLRQFFLN